MTDQGPFEIVVHGQVKQTLDTRLEAYQAARNEKRQNPNKQVSVRDGSGLSTPEDCF